MAKIYKIKDILKAKKKKKRKERDPKNHIFADDEEGKVHVDWGFVIEILLIARTHFQNDKAPGSKDKAEAIENFLEDVQEGANNEWWSNKHKNH